MTRYDIHSVDRDPEGFIECGDERYHVEGIQHPVRHEIMGRGEIGFGPNSFQHLGERLHWITCRIREWREVAGRSCRWGSAASGRGDETRSEACTSARKA